MTLEPAAVLLTDRVAVVTGAAVGIGEAIARSLLRRPPRALRPRRPSLAATAQGGERGRRVHTAELDVREARVEAFLALVHDELGPIDIS